MINRNGRGRTRNLVLWWWDPNGESQVEARRRYLSHHPKSAGFEVKIFHYPISSSRKS
jgi:hypothetical protein